MDDKILDPEGARERLAAWKGRIDKLAADTQVMSDRLREVRVTKRDPAGLAEVTIDSTGSLLDLRLTDRIRDEDPAKVARAVMATIRDAKSELADLSQEIIAETVGTESPAARAIADSVGQHLRGDLDPEDAVAPAPDDEGDDEGYDIRSSLGRY